MAVSYYTVGGGDTWESLALRYRIPVSWLQLANGADATAQEVKLLEPGDLIKIPDPPPPVCLAPGSDNTIAYDPPYLAAFGPTIEFFARSYAPFDEFGTPIPGLGFEGDNRSYSTSIDVTARITAIATFTVATNKVTFRAFSNQSTFPWFPKIPYDPDFPVDLEKLQAHATATPTIKGWPTFNAAGQLTSIYMEYAAGVPLVPHSPDIDVHTTFDLSLDGDGSLVIATRMDGDGFPHAESFVRLSDGRSVSEGRTALLTHYEVPASWLPWNGAFWFGQFTGPFTNLMGDGHMPMGSTTVRLPPPGK